MRPQGLNDLHAYSTDRGAKVHVSLKLLMCDEALTS
jgi:hypothetical protein